MPEYPLAKKIADASFGTIHRGTVALLEMLNPSLKNRFDLILIPKSLGSLSSVGSALLDQVVTRVNIQGIQFQTPSFEYNMHNEFKTVKDITYPESITINFLETEEGLIKKYLNKWKYEVYNEELNLFRDDQEGSLKNGYVIPLLKSGAPSLVWFELLGLQFNGFGDQNFEQSSGEAVILPCTLKVDQIKIYEVI